MSKENIDKIFNDGLNSPMKFANEERQWIEVQKRLKSSNRKHFIWLWFIGISLIIFLIFKTLILESSDRQDQLVIPKNNQNQHTIIQKNAEKKPLSNSINTLESSNSENPNMDDSKPESLDKIKNNITNLKVTAPARHDEKYEPTLDKTNYQNNGQNRNTNLSIKANTYSTTETKGYNENNLYTNQLENNKESLNSNDYLEPINSIPLKLSLIENNKNPLRIEEEMIKIAPRKENNNLGFSFELGVTTDFLNSDLLSYLRDYSPYAGVDFSFFDKAILSIGYNSQKINRSIGQNFLTFNVPQLYNPYQPELPDTTNLQYSNKNIDINFNYKIWNSRLLKVFVGIGSQVNKNEKQNLVYIYGNQYSTYIEEHSAEVQNWHFSDITMNLNIEFPINKRFSISNHYRYYRPLETTNYHWPNRFRIMLGIQYKLKI